MENIITPVVNTAMTIDTSLFANAAGLMAITMGIVGALRMTRIPRRIIPLIALVVGIGASFLALGISGINALLGVAIGLQSMGLWSGGKATLGK